MRFKNDSQRRAAFANMGSNKFSLFDRVRSTADLVGKRDALAYKINNRRNEYSEDKISDMVEEISKLDARIRDREKDKIANEGHGFVRKSVDSVADFFHEPKPEPVYTVIEQVPVQTPAYNVVVQQEYPREVLVEQTPVKKSFGGSFADAIVNLYP